MPTDLDDELQRYYVKPKEPGHEHASIDECVSNLGDKLKDLKATVAEVQAMIEERKSLGHEVCKEIEEELCRATSFLGQFEMPGAIRAGMERIRSIFEREVFALKSEKRKELVKEWEDISRLRQELREHAERMEDLKRQLKEAKK